MGGTKIEAVLVNNQGEVLQRTRIPTMAHEGATVVLERIEAAAKAVMTKKVQGVGIGLPGRVHQGILLGCPNIPSLIGKSVHKLLQKRFDVPVIVENDANCFAIAEHHWGAAKGKKDVCGVVVGTGIGAGIITDNKLYPGSRGGAGEYGAIPYADSSVEEYASGQAILKRYKAKGGKLNDVKSIFKSKEKIAVQTITEAIHTLGWMLITIAKTVEPELIVIGGGVSNEPILKPLREILKEANRETKLVKNKLGGSSGVLGAASLVFRN